MADKEKNKTIVGVILYFVTGACLPLAIFSIWISVVPTWSARTELPGDGSTGKATAETTRTRERLLDDAENALNSGHPERVKEMLFPMVDTWDDPLQQARGYRLLGDSEMALGHPKLAAYYYDKLYGVDDSADNLYLLAFSYDMGGDLKMALRYYDMLLETYTADSSFDRDFVQERVDDIHRTMGTPAPTAEP